MTKSNIAWTDDTYNPIVGCTKISQGCLNCYAATAANTPRLQQFEQYQNVVDHKGNWNGKIEFVPKVLDQLLKLKRPRKIFMPSMSDPFHDAVKDEWLDQIFATIALTPHLTYQLLTKRPERMLQYFTETWQGRPEQEFEGIYIPASGPSSRADEVCFACEEIIDRHKLADTDKDSLWTEGGSLKIMQWGWPLPNLHLGVTVENQAAADERIPLLLQTPAAVRFLSVEPMLERISLDCLHWDGMTNLNCLTGKHGVNYPLQGDCNKVDWVIVGGESGTKARFFYLEWAESMIEQCKSAQVPVFVKQIGSNAWERCETPEHLKEIAPEMESFCQIKTKSRAGSNPDEWPEHLRIQEFPKTNSDTKD